MTMWISCRTGFVLVVSNDGTCAALIVVGKLQLLNWPGKDGKVEFGDNGEPRFWSLLICFIVVASCCFVPVGSSFLIVVTVQLPSPFCLHWHTAGDVILIVVQSMILFGPTRIMESSAQTRTDNATCNSRPIVTQKQASRSDVDEEREEMLRNWIPIWRTSTESGVPTAEIKQTHGSRM